MTGAGAAAADAGAGSAGLDRTHRRRRHRGGCGGTGGQQRQARLVQLAPPVPPAAPVPRPGPASCPDVPAACRPGRPAPRSGPRPAARCWQPGFCTRDSSRCAISPRRMAPASRALPLKVCRQRMQADGGRGIGRRSGPVAQCRMQHRQQFLRLFAEDGQQFVVDRVDGVDVVVDAAGQVIGFARRGPPAAAGRPAPRTAAAPHGRS